MDQRYNLYNLEASFKNYLSAGIKKISVKNYLSDIRHFFGWLIFKLKTQDSFQINYSQFAQQISPELIEDYKIYLLVNKIPRKTINRRLSAIRKFCSFCISQGWIKENPAKKIQNIAPDIKYPASNRKKELDDFEKDLIEKGLDKKEIENTLADIKEFFSVISS